MAKIEFVRKYDACYETWYEVLYTSRRLYTYTDSKLPRTVRKFVESASNIKEQYDKIFKRNETIYTA